MQVFGNLWQWKRIRYLGLGFCASMLTLALSLPRLPVLAHIPTIAPSAPAPPVPITGNNPAQLVQTGKQYYQSGQYVFAITAWQQAAQEFSRRGDRLNQAVVLSNLALAYQQLGQWTPGNQAIAEALNLLKNQANKGNLSNAEVQKHLGQALNIQGSLQVAQGQAAQALITWQAATAAYRLASEDAGVIRSLINQSQALRALGLYPRARTTLAEVSRELQPQPDSLLKAAALLNYGDALRLMGDLAQSEKVLQESLAIAQRLQSPPDITLALLSLGNTARAQQSTSQALSYYAQAIATSPAASTTVQIRLNQLRLLADANRLNEAEALLPQIRSQLDNLPKGRNAVYARVNFVQSLLKLKNDAHNLAGSTLPSLSWKDTAQLLATAVQYAREIGDQRAESYATGYLGEIYEKVNQTAEAYQLTKKALTLAQNSNAGEISYRWQWQLGRILKAQGKPEQAIAAYSEAVSTLNSIRKDLASSSSDIQFSFRESVEPVYREFVALLLEPSKQRQYSQEYLKKAREVIESLQLAELDNFFKEACLTARETQVDQVDSRSAVIYPIILRDRLEVVMSVPNKPLRHYTTVISQPDLEQLIDRMRRSLRRSSLPPERTEIAQKLYNLLIRPEEAELADNQIQTLAFVLDGPMRNLPMAALSDGKQFLIEKYSLALTPGLQLFDPRPLKRQALKVLIGALSQERQGFSALPGVEAEIQKIKAEVPTEVLFNQNFTTDTFQEQVRGEPFRVVHLATHGQFSSNADDTFILTWDRRIDVKQLGELLQAREQDTRTPIELLVLSACQTAEGDRRAVLGLAGVAVRSGARSTLATLWAVDDQSTAQLMVQFYQELARTGTTKAEALRQSQLKLLSQARFRHPYYWAPFVLVGNWL